MVNSIEDNVIRMPLERDYIEVNSNNLNVHYEFPSLFTGLAFLIKSQTENAKNRYFRLELA